MKRIPHRNSLGSLVRAARTDRPDAARWGALLAAAVGATALARQGSALFGSSKGSGALSAVLGSSAAKVGAAVVVSSGVLLSMVSGAQSLLGGSRGGVDGVGKAFSATAAVRLASDAPGDAGSPPAEGEAPLQVEAESGELGPQELHPGARSQKQAKPGTAGRPDEPTAALRPRTRGAHDAAAPRGEGRDREGSNPPTGDLIAEVELIDAARRALKTDPAAALRLVRRHERTFPAGHAVTERTVLGIEALAALGRTAEAKARFAAFEQAHPQSLHLPRLRRILQLEVAHP